MKTNGDQFGVYADISKILSDFKWKPSLELENGIKDMMHFYKIN